MAEPVEDTDQLNTELVAQFDAYLVQVKRLLTGVATNVRRALNSDRINGYTLAELIALIRGEVKAHEDANNPHNETLTQLGGMTTTTFESLAVNYFKKDAIPVSKIPTLSASILNNVLTVSTNQMVYMGRKVDLPVTPLTLSGTAKRYLKVNIANPQPGRVATYTLETNDSETINKFIAGILTFANGSWTVTMIPGVFLGGARLSEFVKGNSIPHSAGSQAEPSFINNFWFS